MEFDLIVKGAAVVTETGPLAADICMTDGVIA
jgi:hypothetical protein